MTDNTLQQFLQFLADSLTNNQFLKLTISHRRDKNSELKTVACRVVMLKNELKLSFVYHYYTKDITKNYDFAAAIKLVEELLHKDFMQADVFTTTENQFLIINQKNGVKVNKKKVSAVETTALNHDNIKRRFISLHNNIYLHELGITTADGKLAKNIEDKYRQIDKYIEILDGIIRSAELPEAPAIVDMGSGKGYLTFALYDYLTNTLHQNSRITGVEARQQLVDTTNAIARKAGFKNLKFITGSIQEAKIDKTDMLIALHACDTATDDAIYRGIQENVKVIICAPCCHKQIRKQMKPHNMLKQITRHGILAERQAEMLTDTIRAMIMEAYGYKTKVFEFISGEHTPKNLLIVGIKKKDVSLPDAAILSEITAMEKLFNIEYHQLEKLFKIL